MLCRNWYVIVLSLFVIFTVLTMRPLREHFMAYTRLRCPTRNMSYDLRGEAYYPPRDENVWMNSEIGVVNPKECSM